MTTPLSRRRLLADLGLAALAATPLAGCIVGGEPPLPYGRVRAVRLDVAPLVAKGLPTWAARVAALAEPPLARAFAAILAPNDPRAPLVTVTVDEIHLAPSPGGGDPDGGAFPTDALDTVRGRLVTSPVAGLPSLDRRLLVSRPSQAAGPWYVADNEDRRLAAVMADFAQWARREFP